MKWGKVNRFPVILIDRYVGMLSVNICCWCFAVRSELCSSTVPIMTWTVLHLGQVMC